MTRFRVRITIESALYKLVWISESPRVSGFQITSVLGPQ